MLKNKRAKSLVVIMLIIAVSAFILRFAVIKAIRLNISYDETIASATLKLISAALENYSKDNKGLFPSAISELVITEPAYLDRDYTKQFPIKGYNYVCDRLDSLGYNCSAVPIRCNITGQKIFKVSTGSLFVTQDCRKEE
ncbi:MAG: hypothetical protein WCY12_03765 [Candidatus Omnitrophota bacterium]